MHAVETFDTVLFLFAHTTYFKTFWKQEPEKEKK